MKNSLHDIDPLSPQKCLGNITFHVGPGRKGNCLQHKDGKLTLIISEKDKILAIGEIIHLISHELLSYRIFSSSGNPVFADVVPNFRSVCGDVILSKGEKEDLWGEGLYIEEKPHVLLEGKSFEILNHGDHLKVRVPVELFLTALYKFSSTVRDLRVLHHSFPEAYRLEFKQEWALMLERLVPTKVGVAD